MVRILDRFLGSQDYPLEVGKVYYSEEAGQHFRVERLHPGLEIITETISDPFFVDKDLYRIKYDSGIIREPDDDVMIIEHE